MDVLQLLDERGFVGQTTSPEIGGLLEKEMVTYYVGFDPTAPSLHIGNLKQIMMMAHLQRSGHRPIALVGGGTGMIGDPSGKSKERILLDKESLAVNQAGIKAQLERFLDFETKKNPALIVNNHDWLSSFTFIDFLRDVGKHFRLSEMLAKESVKIRLNSEEGISFTEFCYQLLQAYDFMHLFDTYKCRLQMGGSDQWGNITAGIDLVRKLRAATVYGVTSPLVTTATGQKFGKTETGTIWLAADRTSPYEFYQYWMRTDDRDVAPFLKIFTFLEMSQIQELERSLKDEPEKREAHRALAHHVTALVHGESEADKAVKASRVLFGEEIAGLSDRDLAAVFADVPGAEIPRDRLKKGVSIADLAAEAGLCKSKGEARRMIQQGGIYINNLRVDLPDKTVGEGDLASENMLVLRSGKKKYLLVKAV